MLSPSSEEGYSALRLQLSLKWPSSCPFHQTLKTKHSPHSSGCQGGAKSGGITYESVWWLQRPSQRALAGGVAGWLKFSALWSVMSREGVGTQRGLCCETHSLFLWGSGGRWPWTLSCVWWYWAAVCPLSCAASFNHDISPVPELYNQSVVEAFWGHCACWPIHSDIRHQGQWYKRYQLINRTRRFL